MIRALGLRLLTGLLLALLLARVVALAQMMPVGSWPQGSTATPPAIDGTATGHAGSNNPGPLSLGTLVTTHANDLIVVAVNNAQGGQTVTGITSSSGLTFTKRAAQNAPTGVGFKTRLDYWTAPAASPLGGETFTISLSGSSGPSTFMAFGIKGLNNIASPFDANGTLPTLNAGLGSGGTTPSISGLSTTSARTILLFFDATYVSGATSFDPSSAPTGFTLAVKSIDLNFGDPLYAYYKVVSVSQSSITISDGSSWASGGSSVNWAAIGDAVVTH